MKIHRKRNSETVFDSSGPFFWPPSLLCILLISTSILRSASMCQCNVPMCLTQCSILGALIQNQACASKSMSIVHTLHCFRAMCHCNCSAHIYSSSIVEALPPPGDVANRLDTPDISSALHSVAFAAHCATSTARHLHMT